jgi:hypothetical protein
MTRYVGSDCYSVCQFHGQACELSLYNTANSYRASELLNRSTRALLDAMK